MCYLDGYNVTTDVHLDSFDGQQAVVTLRNSELKMFGGDIATTVGNYGLRAEFAYANTADTDGSNPFIMNRYLEFVAGGDRTFDDYRNFNLQAFVRHVFDFNGPDELSDPIQRLPINQIEILMD